MMFFESIFPLLKFQLQSTKNVTNKTDALHNLVLFSTILTPMEECYF